MGARILWCNCFHGIFLFPKKNARRVSSGRSRTRYSRSTLNIFRVRLGAAHGRRRLSPSLKDLLQIMERVQATGAGFRSITEAVDIMTSAAGCSCKCLAASRNSKAGHCENCLLRVLAQHPSSHPTFRCGAQRKCGRFSPEFSQGFFIHVNHGSVRRVFVHGTSTPARPL